MNVVVVEYAVFITLVLSVYACLIAATIAMVRDAEKK